MVDKKELFDFVDRAGKATYAGGGKYEEIFYKGEKVFWHRVVGGILKHE
ncbi:hypothetical protein HY008_00095 [Candidatus Woesebacteria bacterium]|nr:hypothetical protein [Candidatus Woesebacteria bacterium]